MRCRCADAVLSSRDSSVTILASVVHVMMTDFTYDGALLRMYEHVDSHLHLRAQLPIGYSSDGKSG
jgi:hypothetical protein